MRHYRGELVHDILIIDADRALAADLKPRLAAEGFRLGSAQTLANGLSQLHTGSFKALILGDNLPDGDCLSFLSKIRNLPVFPGTICLTGSGDPDRAETAIRNGAWDVVPKPPAVERLCVLLRRIADHHDGLRGKPPRTRLKRHGIVGNSRLLRACLETIEHAAASDCNVLIIGETGTGKELFARAIHRNSLRSSKSFVVVDCAALPGTLVESVLFGHEKGAFTSAESPSAGLVMQADGGTLFLDEIGELPLSIQKVFLRVLEGRTFRAVGGARELSSDFRLLAATNRDLEAMVEAGTFRRDLYYRLRATRIDLPPLREIPEDIPVLVGHCLQRLARNTQTPPKGFTPDFLDSLLKYSWPGNIRELMHTVERSLTAARSEPLLDPRHLPLPIRAQVARSAHKPEPANTPDDRFAFFEDTLPTMREFRESAIADAERIYLQKLMELTRWNIARACVLSGLSRARLYALLKEHGIARP